MRQKYEINQYVSSGQEKPQVNLLELRLLFQPHIERIIHELRRSLAYYKEQSGGRRVENFFFSNAGAQQKNFLSVFSEQIGGKCQILLPFKNIELVAGERIFKDELSQTPVFAGAAGLALAVSAAQLTKTINFPPEELKRKKAKRFQLTVLTIFGIFLMAVFILGWLNALYKRYSLKAALSKTDFEMELITQKTIGMEDLKQREQEIRQRSSQIAKAANEVLNFRFPLRELFRLTPDEIYWIKVSIIENKESKNNGSYIITLVARVFANYEYASHLIQVFQDRLVSSRYFRQIDILPLKLEEISADEVVVDEDTQLTQES